MGDFDTLCGVLEQMDPVTFNDLIEEKTRSILDSLEGIMADDQEGVAIYFDFILCSVAADGVLTEEEFAWPSRSWT